MCAEKILEIAAPIAPVIVKYLFDTVKKWVSERDSKKASKVSGEAASVKVVTPTSSDASSVSAAPVIPVVSDALFKEIEDLKDKLDAKDRSKITVEDVHEVKQKLAEVQAVGASIQKDVGSIQSVIVWASTVDVSKNDNTDIEDISALYLYNLRNAIDQADQLGLKRREKEDLQELRVSLDVNLNNYLDARRICRIREGPKFQGAFQDAQYRLRDTVEYAREVTKPLWTAQQ